MSVNPVEDAVEILKNLAISGDLEKKLEEAKQRLLDTYYTYSGIANQKQLEIKPNYDQASNEVVIEGKTNSYIILGSDRDGGLESGLGGVGTTAAASVDIVAGLMGQRPANNVNGVPARASKNFFVDAARVYISQASDIDKTLNIPKYSHTVGAATVDDPSCVGKSTVAIVSDHTRIYGRESVKIITSHFGTNATTTDVEPIGVDIIAGYDVPDTQHLPQPMVKGNNLVACLSAIINNIQLTQATVTTFLERQTKINQIIVKHTHMDSTGRTTKEMLENGVTKEIIEIQKTLVPDIIKNESKFSKDIADYFNPISKRYINSVFNRVN